MENDKRRILIVEDNILIAMDVEAMVAEMGCIPVGPASSVSGGLDIVRNSEIDGAVLDINLGNERVWPVAELLDQRGIPFVLATGYTTTEVPERFGDRIILEKPLLAEALSAALAELRIIQLGD